MARTYTLLELLPRGVSVRSTRHSFVSGAGNWDPIARDWIAAQAGHDAFGAWLAFDPDGDLDGSIKAEEAFGYADVT